MEGNTHATVAHALVCSLVGLPPQFSILFHFDIRVVSFELFSQKWPLGNIFGEKLQSPEGGHPI